MVETSNPFHLETDRLIIRNWQAQDRPLFHLINSDDGVMEYFPFRRTRDEADILMDTLQETITKTGIGFTAIALKGSNEAIGFCGLADAKLEDDIFEGSIEIGWRLAPQFQGKGYVTEAALALLAHGFQQLHLPEIVAFAVPENVKSTAVMQRLGMTHMPKRDFIHPRVPDTHPHLKPHVTYVISREEWQAKHGQ